MDGKYHVGKSAQQLKSQLCNHCMGNGPYSDCYTTLKSTRIGPYQDGFKLSPVKITVAVLLVCMLFAPTVADLYGYGVEVFAQNHPVVIAVAVGLYVGLVYVFVRWSEWRI